MRTSSGVTHVAIAKYRDDGIDESSDRRVRRFDATSSPRARAAARRDRADRRGRRTLRRVGPTASTNAFTDDADVKVTRSDVAVRATAHAARRALAVDHRSIDHDAVDGRAELLESVLKTSRARPRPPHTARARRAHRDGRAARRAAPRPRTARARRRRRVRARAAPRLSPARRRAIFTPASARASRPSARSASQKMRTAFWLVKISPTVFGESSERRAQRAGIERFDARRRHLDDLRAERRETVAQRRRLRPRARDDDALAEQRSRSNQAISSRSATTSPMTVITGADKLVARDRVGERRERRRRRCADADTFPTESPPRAYRPTSRPRSARPRCAAASSRPCTARSFRRLRASADQSRSSHLWPDLRVR